MDSRKLVFKETAIVALGQVISVAVMTGIFAMLGYYNSKVLLGGMVGGLIATLNFLFMAIGVSLASDKAAEQDVRGGKATIRSSYLLRLAVMFVVLIACAKSGWFHPVALVLPLAFVRPILTIGEFFKKKGD